MRTGDWLRHATRLVVCVAASGGIATSLSAQTREAMALVASPAVVITINEDGQRATVRARGASVRAVLAGLADRARFTLVNLDRVPDTTIDVEFVDVPVSRIVKSLLRSVQVDYMAAVGPTELTLKTLIIAGAGSAAGTHMGVNGTAGSPATPAGAVAADGGGGAFGLSSAGALDAPTSATTDANGVTEGRGTATATDSRLNVSMASSPSDQLLRTQDVVGPGVQAPSGPPVGMGAWSGAIDDASLPTTGLSVSGSAGSGGVPPARTAAAGATRPGLFVPPGAAPGAASAIGRVTPEEAVAGLSQVPLGAENTRTATGTIGGPVPMSGPPPGTPPQVGVTAPGPAAAGPTIK
jgi:hypothetical protein